jgi:hypothetical protein
MSETCYLKIATSKNSLIAIDDLAITAFVFGPLCIFNWTCTYELFDLILKYCIGDDNFQCNLASFTIGQMILLVLYLSQYFLQGLYSKLSHHKQFLFVPKILITVYTYVLLIAYTSQWKSGWFFYEFLFQTSSSSYQFYALLAGLFAWVNVLNNSLKSLSQVIPFVLHPDHNIDNYFHQAVKIKYKQVNP